MSLLAVAFHGLRPGAARCRPVAAALAAVVCWLLGGAAGADSLEDVEACVASNFPKKASAVSFELRSRHRDGFESRHEGRTYWRRSAEGRTESLICLEQPPSVRGLAYLVVQDDSGVAVWGYLPEKQRVLRIHASAAAKRARIGRTAISYDDLRYLPINLSGAQPEKIRNAVVADREVFVVGLVLPPGGDSPYARVVAFVDRESCVALRTELYETPDRLLKVLTVDPDEIRSAGGIRLAHEMTLEDLKNEVVTELKVVQVEVDPELPDRMFAPTRLDRNRCRGVGE